MPNFEYPESLTRWPAVGEPLVRQTYYEDLGRLEGRFPEIPKLKPFIIKQGNLSAILNALATHGEGEQEIQEVGEIDIDSD